MRRHHRALLFPWTNGTTYLQKLQALGLIALWAQAEPPGATVALDSSGNGRTGAYTAVTLGQTGIGSGQTAASYDGSTSFTNVFSASFNTAFNGGEGTVMGWSRYVAGTWTDGASRRIVSFLSDANNNLFIRKDTTNNQIAFQYAAGGTPKSVTSVAIGGTTAWFHVAMTWSKSGDALRAYINGAQVGATQTGLGTWAGALSNTQTILGGLNTTPTVPHLGLMAYVGVADRALTATEIASAAAG